MLLRNLRNLIHKPTRINNNSATIIDNIFTNVSTEQIFAAVIMATKAYSDHFPIFAILKNVSREKNDNTVVKIIFCQKNIAKFNKYLKHADWNQVYSSNDTSESYTLFHTIVNTVFNTVFPEIKYTVTYKNRYPWLTNALRKSITVKNNLSTLSVLEPANVSLKIQYKSYKNKLTSLLRNAELAYYSNKLEINKSDHSKSWKRHYRNEHV